MDAVLIAIIFYGSLRKLCGCPNSFWCHCIATRKLPQHNIGMAKSNELDAIIHEDKESEDKPKELKTFPTGIDNNNINVDIH